jgi:hypothetical protein
MGAQGRLGQLRRGLEYVFSLHDGCSSHVDVLERPERSMSHEPTPSETLPRTEEEVTEPAPAV